MTVKLIENRNNYKCGCIVKKDGNTWVFDEYCDAHKPNWPKKADKYIHRSEVASRRKKYLEERARRKKRAKK